MQKPRSQKKKRPAPKQKGRPLIEKVYGNIGEFVAPLERPINAESLSELQKYISPTSIENSGGVFMSRKQSHKAGKINQLEKIYHSKFSSRPGERESPSKQAWKPEKKQKAKFRNMMDRQQQPGSRPITSHGPSPFLNPDPMVQAFQTTSTIQGFYNKSNAANSAHKSMQALNFESKGANQLSQTQI